MEKTPTKLLEDEVKKLSSNLKKQKSLLNLITNVRKLFPYTFGKKKVKDKELKRNIVAEVTKAKEYNKVLSCLEAIGLSLCTYKRWRAEIRPCIITKDLCAKSTTNTITLDELKKLKNYILSPKYQHVPISRLHLLAQRNNDLFCSPNTWYKYNNIFEWRNFLPLNMAIHT